MLRRVTVVDGVVDDPRWPLKLPTRPHNIPQVSQHFWDILWEFCCLYASVHGEALHPRRMVIPNIYHIQLWVFSDCGHSKFLFLWCTKSNEIPVSGVQMLALLVTVEVLVVPPDTVILSPSLANTTIWGGWIPHTCLIYFSKTTT